MPKVWFCAYSRYYFEIVKFITRERHTKTTALKWVRTDSTAKMRYSLFHSQKKLLAVEVFRSRHSQNFFLAVEVFKGWQSQISFRLWKFSKATNWKLPWPLLVVTLTLDLLSKQFLIGYWPSNLTMIGGKIFGCGGFQKSAQPKIFSWLWRFFESQKLWKIWNLILAVESVWTAWNAYPDS